MSKYAHRKEDLKSWKVEEETEEERKGGTRVKPGTPPLRRGEGVGIRVLVHLPLILAFSSICSHLSPK
jgi:hypothetical protein